MPNSKRCLNVSTLTTLDNLAIAQPAESLRTEDSQQIEELLFYAGADAAYIPTFSPFLPTRRHTVRF